MFNLTDDAVDLEIKLLQLELNPADDAIDLEIKLLQLIGQSRSSYQRNMTEASDLHLIIWNLELRGAERAKLESKNPMTPGQ